MAHDSEIIRQMESEFPSERPKSRRVRRWGRAVLLTSGLVLGASYNAMMIGGVQGALKANVNDTDEAVDAAAMGVTGAAAEMQATADRSGAECDTLKPYRKKLSKHQKFFDSFNYRSDGEYEAASKDIHQDASQVASGIYNNTDLYLGGIYLVGQTCGNTVTLDSRTDQQHFDGLEGILRQNLSTYDHALSEQQGNDISQRLLDLIYGSNLQRTFFAAVGSAFVGMAAVGLDRNYRS